MKMANNLSPEDVESILVELGYDLQDRGSYWQTNALFRNGDNKTALQIYKNTGVWRDFVENTPPLPFQKLIETHLGTNDPTVIAPYLQGSSSTAPYVAPPPKLSSEEIYEEDCLKKLFPHYSFYSRRGISSPLLKFLKAGLATEGQMYQRFVFPIYNEHRQIHGFSGRYMGTRQTAPKWKHLGKKRNWIYPYYLEDNDGSFPVQEAIEENNAVILVESIGDMLNLWEHGYKNSLVVFGLDASPQLICHLMSLNVKQITISFNNDGSSSLNAGVLGSLKTYLKLLNYFDVERLRICLPTKNDFGEMDAADFQTWNVKCSQWNVQTQGRKILNYIEQGAKDGLISANLFKNSRALEDFLNE